MKCKNCNKQLEQLDNIETDYQFDNAMWITFNGGYGMFIESSPFNNNDIEPIHFKDSDFEVVICHECSHDLCNKIPWIKDLLKPLKSHSHTQEFWDNNPDHEAWDNPKNKLP